MKIRINPVLALTLLITLVATVLVSPAYAASSVVHDPTGDAVLPSGDPAPPYMDIVNANVIEQRGKGTLFFLIEVAGPIPKEPPESFLAWNCQLDTDPATFPATGGGFYEFSVRVRWVGGQFEGTLEDFRPTLTGGSLVVTPIPFSVDGATTKAFVDLELLDNPSSFDWRAVTRNAPGQQVPAPPLTDRAPDTGLATWTK